MEEIQAQAPVAQETAPVVQPQVETAQVEAPVQPPVEETPKRNEFIEKFNKLNKKEREYEQKRAELIEKEKRLSRFEELETAKDPLKIMQAYGLTIEDVANRLIEDKAKDTPEHQIKTIQQQFDELKAERQRELDEKKKQEEEYFNTKKQQQIDESLAHINKRVIELLDASTEADITKGLKDYKAVFDTVLEVVKLKPESFQTLEDIEKILPEAINAVESQYEAKFDLIKDTQKIKKKLGLFKEDDEKQKQPELLDQAKKSLFQRTLTNTMPATPVKSETSGKLLSREESLKQSAAFLRSELLKKK